MNWLKQIRNPPAMYRSTPFWAWNGKLEKTELIRQVREFARGGCGGFFMHPRSGLETPYLSKEFLDCVKTAVAEAKRLGMEAWLYDEDRWPSGFGGGAVTRHPEYRARALVWNTVPDSEFAGIPEDSLRCFSARVQGLDAFDVKPLRGGARPGPGRTAVVFKAVVSRTGSPWFTGQCYVDVLNPRAVREFIRCTHEVYRREIGAEFGATVPGIFTDEPNYGGFTVSPGEHPRAYPWTARFPEEFRKRIGYDLLGRLVEISHRVEGRSFSRVRLDYRAVASRLFEEAFSRQIGKWCARNNLELTGHLMAEDTPDAQADRVGACMRHYVWFQRPGIDVLCDKTPEVLTAKQAVSVASQLGRKRVLSELYGCTGWDTTFATYKHIGDWHQVLGINHFCQHVSWYSMGGEGKRDYPASIFHQSPWWGDHRLLGDYFGRLSLALSQGAPIREVCVVHPIETAWATRIKAAKSVTAGFGDALNALCTALLDNQYDFDFADEEFLRENARIRHPDGVVRLNVGAMRYRVVVVPESLTLQSSTVALLERFAGAGGRLVFFGRPPDRVDGRPSRRIARLVSKAAWAPIAGGVLTEALGADPRVASLTKLNGLSHDVEPKTWVHARRTREGELLFLVNMDRAQPDRSRLNWRGEGRVWEIALLDGRRREVRGARIENGQTQFVVDMPPGGSRLYLRTPGQPTRRRAARAPVEVRRIPLGGVWDYRLDDPNVLTLDYARMRVSRAARPAREADGNLWRDRDLVWRHEAALRKELGFPGGGEQPYAREPSNEFASIELEYVVRARQVPREPVTLVMEHPERFEIRLNDSVVPNRARGWWIDKAFKVVPLDGFRLRRGRNVLRLATDYRPHHSLEDIYLAGRFGVTVAGDRAVIERLPARLHNGDWVPQGLAMYSGAVTYEQKARIPRLAKGERAVLWIGRPAATVVRVAVNGRKIATLGWSPWRVDITRAVRPGATNTIAITLVSSRRNMLGPLHHAMKRRHWIGPVELRPGQDCLIPEYSLVEYGLMEETSVTIEEILPGGSEAGGWHVRS